MLEALKEIFSSIKKTSSERIKSPFYGVFVLTWAACNWKPLSILLFSDSKIIDRIQIIDKSYNFHLLLPILIAALLAYVLPIINEKVTWLQSKPLHRTATLVAVRKKKALVADISVEKFRAKRDVTYERSRTNAEKEIQNMREEITSSQTYIESINGDKERLEKQLSAAMKVSEQRAVESRQYKDYYEDLKIRFAALEKLNQDYEQKYKVNAINNDSITQLRERQNEIAKNSEFAEKKMSEKDGNKNDF